MRTQSVLICAIIIPPVHVFLGYLSFSVKSVTRRLHLVPEFQKFPGEDTSGLPYWGGGVCKADPTGCANSSFQNDTHKTILHTPARYVACAQPVRTCWWCVRPDGDPVRTEGLRMQPQRCRIYASSTDCSYTRHSH